MHANRFDEASWDAALHQASGDLLQSWRWGEFKRRHGWVVDRIRIDGSDGYALAQIMFRQRGPFSIAYIPRGPVISGDFADDGAFWTAIDSACAARRAVHVVIEPERPLPDVLISREHELTRGPQWFQTARTVKVPLTDDDILLAQMRKDTRYNINYARRHGVTVERVQADPERMAIFYRLLQETSRRGSFGIHTPAYYDDFMRIFGDQAVLLLAHANGEVTAGLIAARCGPEGRSMYSGTATNHRIRGDAALLRFEAMRWTRELGGTHYDMGGIAPAPFQAPLDEQSGSGLDGVNRFKMGFGGEVVVYPQTLERRYRPALAWLIRRINPKFREAPLPSRSLDQ